jgi:hypothetical protein
MEPQALDRPPVLDELTRALRDLPPLGRWIESASCASLGVGSEVFTADHPDVEELELAAATCRRCPVRQQCRAYAAQAPVWGLWAGRWHGRRAKATQAEPEPQRPFPRDTPVAPRREPIRPRSGPIGNPLHILLTAVGKGLASAA